MVREQKILVFGSPGTENTGFWWSGDKKYWVLVVRGQKILVFSGSGTENIGFGRSREGSGGEGRTAADGRGRPGVESWTP